MNGSLPACLSRTLGSLLLLSLLGAHAAPAQEDPAPADELFEVVDVEIVNIDVWVNDRDGRPIAGLGPEDFVVLRDGLPVELANFYAVDDGRPVGREEEPSEEEPEEEAPAAALDRLARRESSPVDPEHRLWLIVFVDNYNIDPIERDRVLPAVQGFVSRTTMSSDRVMIATYDRALEVRTPFTDDRAKLLATLDEIGKESGFLMVRRREEKELLKRIDRAKDPRRALLAVRTYAEEIRDSVDRTVETLERLVDSLGGLPGRKALVHVSSGIPMLAGEEMFHVVGEKFGVTEAYAEVSRYDTTRAWERLDRTANAHRVVFYTLDAGGLRGMHYAGAEYEGLGTPHLRRTMDSIAPENLQAPLRLMALETGGRAIVNRNEALPALEEVRQDFLSFYSLGISSSGVDSSRYHEVEVRLRDAPRGATVRHRGAYRSKDQETRMRERVRSALFYDADVDPLGLEVRWGRVVPQADSDLVVLPVELRIPLRDLALLPVRGGKHELRLELYVGAAGTEDDLSTIEPVPLGLRIAPEHVEAARNETFIHTHRLLVAPGQRKIALGLLDVFGQQWSVVSSILDVPTGGS